MEIEFSFTPITHHQSLNDNASEEGFMSPSIVFPHNLPDYVVVDPEPTTVVEDPTDSGEQQKFTTSISPNGTKWWYPIVSNEHKPIIGSTFDSFDEVMSMYRQYGVKAGFCIRKGQTKLWKGVVTHKYVRCNRAGKPQKKRRFDSLCESSTRVRQCTYSLTDCTACICVHLCPTTSRFELISFLEQHNHPLIDPFNRDLSKISRKLPFSTKQFIHNMSLNRIGPVKSHRFMVSLMGGHHNVHGTPDDYKNFSTSMRIYIGDRDSQLVVERFRERQSNCPEFYYDMVVDNGRLRCLFWADETSKLNYDVFGDVVAFDATYHTNKYNMIFVPFTGVDHHKNCVTFGAGLIFNETSETYIWLLEAFLRCHSKQPRLILSDQDPAMHQAVTQVFTESRHRLCMWHVTKKLKFKVPSRLLENTDLKQSLNRLVWSVFIKPSTFESRWHELIRRFGLENNEWLADMFEIRDRWVPAYFRDIPMCCLMKTTSRCESSNASFKVGSSSANTLVQFMLCFETRIDSQRYRQRVAEFKSSIVTYQTQTGLEIEKHAFDYFTHTIYKEVQKEIIKGMFSCYPTNTKEVEGLIVYDIAHLDKRNDIINTFKVNYDPKDKSASCSCMCFTRIGYLCRHIFCVYRINSVVTIPSQYMSGRWRRDILPRRIFEIQARYGASNTPQSVLRTQILEIIQECVDAIRGDTDALTEFVNKLKELKDVVMERNTRELDEPETNVAVIEELIGQTLNVNDDVDIGNPSGIRTKGCGKHRRLIGAAEANSVKPPRAPRLCKTCQKYVTDHDSRNCKKKQAEKEMAEKERAENELAEKETASST